MINLRSDSKGHIKQGAFQNISSNICHSWMFQTDTSLTVSSFLNMTIQCVRDAGVVYL